MSLLNAVTGLNIGENIWVRYKRIAFSEAKNSNLYDFLWLALWQASWSFEYSSMI